MAISLNLFRFEIFQEPLDHKMIKPPLQQQQQQQQVPGYKSFSNAFTQPLRAIVNHNKKIAETIEHQVKKIDN